MSRFLSTINRILFVGAFVLAGIAVCEKALNFAGFTMLRGYPPSRVLEVSSVVVLFVIALQLREIKHQQVSGAGSRMTM